GPIRFFRRAGAGMAGGDRGLKRVRAVSAAGRLGALQRRETTADEQVIPPPAVLIEQQDRLPRRADPRGRARRLELHQRDEAVYFWLQWRELGQDPSQPERVLAQRGAHPVVARRCRVALVEDEVNHLEDRGETGGELGSPGHLEGHAGRRQRPLGPHDALRDRGLGDQEGPRDLVGREAAEQAQRESHARLGRVHRMTGRVNEAEEVVEYVYVGRCCRLTLRYLSYIDARIQA